MAGGTFSPTIIVPMLLDWAMTPANVSFSTAWSWESRNDWPARESRLGTTTGVAGVATPATPVVVPNRLSRAGQSFRDSHDHAVEKLTFAGVIAQSSNIGTMMVGEKVPPAILEKYFRSFGVGQMSGVGFPGETAGIFATAKDWSGSQRYTVMYGQGLAVNAIQAAGVFQTIANGGVRVPPTLVASIEKADGTFASTPVSYTHLRAHE